MPASNQLLDGAMVRAAVSAGNLRWSSGDPGTNALPSNRILTWANYKSYISTSGTTQFSDVYCPTYQNMLTYAIVTINPPNVTSASDVSYCDTTIAHYVVHVNFTPGNSSYATRITYENGDLGDAFPGATSFEAEISDPGFYHFSAHHIDSSGNDISGTGTSASVSINFKDCL